VLFPGLQEGLLQGEGGQVECGCGVRADPTIARKHQYGLFGRRLALPAIMVAGYCFPVCKSRGCCKGKGGGPSSVGVGLELTRP